MNIEERTRVFNASIAYADCVKQATNVDTAMYFLFMGKLLYRIAKGEVRDEA